MSTVIPRRGASPLTWAGRVLFGLVVVFLGFDIVIKLLLIQPVVDAMAQLGYSPGFGRVVGVIELASLALYLWPRTAMLGAVLLTAVMGGAIASHARVDDPLFSHTLFGVYLGLFLWAGVWLRDERLRTLMPWRRDA
ncbi:DoxX family protein [Niveibacterium sp. SC-1]|uniref:DoxX family protein n=1 Tax=Niveibacterium sp. SC-1 TaxID=3135646 RepID=UPI00311DC9DA